MDGDQFRARLARPAIGWLGPAPRNAARPPTDPRQGRHRGTQSSTARWWTHTARSARAWPWSTCARAGHLFVNDALADMYGYSPDELLAMPSYLEPLAKDDQPAVDARRLGRLQRASWLPTRTELGVGPQGRLAAPDRGLARGPGRRRPRDRPRARHLGAGPRAAATCATPSGATARSWSASRPSSTRRSRAKSGRWRYVSPYVETMLGFEPPAEWLEDPELWASRLHPEDREMVLEQEVRLAAGERVSMEYRMLARDGSVVWVHDEAPRRGARRRHDPARRAADRRQRAQGRRRAAAAPRRPRRAHRPAQPPPLHGGARAGDRGRAPRHARELGDRARYRRLQAGQRLVRPPRGRRADPRDRGVLAERLRAERRRRPPGRRRVRPAAASWRLVCGSRASIACGEEAGREPKDPDGPELVDVLDERIEGLTSFEVYLEKASEEASRHMALRGSGRRGGLTSSTSSRVLTSRSSPTACAKYGRCVTS